MAERFEWVYLIVTILKTKNSYRLRKSQPKSLAPNEFCYSFSIIIDTDEWLKRIKEITLEKVSPPELPKPGNLSLSISRATSTLVMDRLLGKDEGNLQTMASNENQFKAKERIVFISKNIAMTENGVFIATRGQMSTWRLGEDCSNQ